MTVEGHFTAELSLPEHYGATQWQRSLQELTFVGFCHSAEWNEIITGRWHNSRYPNVFRGPVGMRNGGGDLFFTSYGEVQDWLEHLETEVFEFYRKTSYKWPDHYESLMGVSTSFTVTSLVGKTAFASFDESGIYIDMEFEDDDEPIEVGKSYRLPKYVEFSGDQRPFYPWSEVEIVLPDWSDHIVPWDGQFYCWLSGPDYVPAIRINRNGELLDRDSWGSDNYEDMFQCHAYGKLDFLSYEEYRDFEDETGQLIKSWSQDWPLDADCFGLKTDFVFIGQNPGFRHFGTPTPGGVEVLWLNREKKLIPWSQITFKGD